MNGAESLVRTLGRNGGVDVCFHQPRHVGDALRRGAGRGALGCAACCGLFEGVVTGAADGYCADGRRTPASTLLHLGPGLGERPSPTCTTPSKARHRA